MNRQGAKAAKKNSNRQGAKVAKKNSNRQGAKAAKKNSNRQGAKAAKKKLEPPRRQERQEKQFIAGWFYGLLG